MGQKIHRDPVELRLNEEAYNDFLNHLLDSGRYEEAHRLAMKKKRGVLTSRALVELMAFDGQAIGTGIENETVKEDVDEQLAAQNRLEMEQKIFSDEALDNTRPNYNEVKNLGSGPSKGSDGIFFDEAIHIIPLGNLYPKYKEEKPEEEVQKESLMETLAELVDSLSTGDLELSDALEFLRAEVVYLEDFILGDSYDEDYEQ